MSNVESLYEEIASAAAERRRWARSYEIAERWTVLGWVAPAMPVALINDHTHLAVLAAVLALTGLMAELRAQWFNRLERLLDERRPNRRRIEELERALEIGSCASAVPAPQCPEARAVQAASCASPVLETARQQTAALQEMEETLALLRAEIAAVCERARAEIAA